MNERMDECSKGNETQESLWYLHVVFEAYGGAHDVGGPAEDFKGKEVVWAGLAEVTLDLHDPWGGNRPALVAAAVCRTPQNSFLGFPSQPQPHTVPHSAQAPGQCGWSHECG